MSFVFVSSALSAIDGKWEITTITNVLSADTGYAILIKFMLDCA
jgi:hypothetical protein